MRITLAIAALLVALPATTHAQGGFLKKMKDKAKEKAAEKVVQKAGQAIDKVSGTTDSASTPSDSAKATTAAATESGGARATPASRPSGAVVSRRAKPLDPTVLESPRDKEPASAAAQGAPQGAPQSAPQAAPQGQDELSKKTWSGTAIAMDKFAGSVPTITTASLDAYIRARTAMHAEAKRLVALQTGGAKTRREFMALGGAPLAEDEKVVLLEYQPYLRISRKLRREYERRLDAVMERELNGAMTRLQFYQLHEMVSIFLDNAANGSTAKGPGRGLTPAELAALEKRKAELLQLRQESTSGI